MNEFAWIDWYLFSCLLSVQNAISQLHYIQNREFANIYLQNPLRGYTHHFILYCHLNSIDIHDSIEYSTNRRWKRDVQGHSFSQMAASFLFLTILSLALSLPAKNAPFTVDSYFVGSWAISSSVVPSNGGEIVENSEKYMYNITKTEDNVLAINYVDIATNMIVEKSSLVCELQSNTSCVMKHSSEDAQMMTISFQPIASKDVYVFVLHIVLCVDLVRSRSSQCRSILRDFHS